MSGANGDEEAGGFKAKGGGAGIGCGDARNLQIGAGAPSDGKGGGVSVDEGDGGRMAVGELDGEAEAEVGSGEAELVLADLVEEAGAVAEDDGDARDGYQTTLPKPRSPVKSDADAVPVGVEGDVVGGSDGHEALGGEIDGAGVGDVELEAWRRGRAAGREGRRLRGSWPV